jgi:hypothetical protein
VRLAAVITPGILVASLSRGAAAQASGDRAAVLDLRVEGSVAYRAETRPATRLDIPGCPFSVREYASPTRTGQLRWDAVALPNVVCTLEQNTARLGQGQGIRCAASHTRRTCSAIRWRRAATTWRLSCV